MENPAATIHCSNIRCQAPNPQSNKFCQQCRTPLLRRYLWAIGQGIEGFQPGDTIAGRYLLIHARVLLDTQPGRPPETPLDIPGNLTPYLRLAPYSLHVPQLYGRLIPLEGRTRSEIWLLEDAPIYSYVSGQSSRKEKAAPPVEGQLLPELTSVWEKAPAMRQLNWLWQLAMLWQPLNSEGVASTLLSPTLLRVEGSVVRLLELQLDPKSAPTLQQLGQLWSQWIAGAAPTIAEFLKQLCTQLRDGQIRTSEQLVALLDQGLKNCGRSQTRTYQIFTRTDSGPSRSHNEDACYPPNGQLIKPANGASALAIVCDGIGGHEGGEVASNLAIDTLREQVEQLPNDPDNWNPSTLTLELEQATCAANDIISQQNDSERRSDRQRMGTTLVMARTSAHEMYITHVGDSRVYWVTRHNCHQVTLDDDLASREVRLGYALYRNAVQQPTAGSLVQALGMAPSATLHPTVQRFVLDEDCVFLLCSDGLSDYDRVEQYWQTEILPILDGRIDLPTAGTRLIEIANSQNGHDNATIALLYCTVNPSKETPPAQLSASQMKVPASSPVGGTLLATSAPSQMKTQPLATKGTARRPWGLLLGIICLLGLGSVLSYFLIPGVSESVDPLMKQMASNTSPPDASTATNPSPATTSADDPTASPAEILSLEPGAVIQVMNSSATNSQPQNVPLLLRRGLPPQNQTPFGVVPTGSILQIINKSPDPQQNSWVELRVCSPGTRNAESQPLKPAQPAAEPPQSPAGQTPGAVNPQPTTLPYPLVKSGDRGWLKEAEVLPQINPNFTLTSECVSPSASPPTSTPVPRAIPSP
ncbi:PP2C family serine/threonine-protein phosphatase [Allocoleopsis franciscana]|uniref:Serine/threonine protein phosphatase n=1 Tax=Allocoleopsis franciscana PCC 7113 TaxID=1173027 RepID=K9WMX5_9CYAN|nr:protein phosphatase 2C domain-containing protein [Allocoleopsis franciscana]AFZ21136.1 serine/threonine protein phosphatase [Allocoleopsis franciscana PCC 7113]